MPYRATVTRSVAMPKPPTARHMILSEIEPFSKRDDLRIVIERPDGSRNEYSYDPGCDCMQLSAVLPEGLVFPYDFGFVPSTLGQDGDPLDVLILMDEPVVPRCVVRAGLIGAIQAEQKVRAKAGRAMAGSSRLRPTPGRIWRQEAFRAPSPFDRGDQGIFRHLQ